MTVAELNILFREGLQRIIGWYYKERDRARAKVAVEEVRPSGRTIVVA